MNEFESTLALALHAEAERTSLQTDTADAANRLEARLERIDHDRRRRTLTALGAAAAAVLVAAGVYGVTRAGSPTTDQPAGRPPHSLPSTTAQDYKMLVGDDAQGVAIYADVTLYGAWTASDHPVLSDSTGNYGGLAVYQPLALAAGTGCLSDKPNTRVGQTPEMLAEQLAQLPRSTVLQSPTRMLVFGRHVIHLQLRINPNCGKGVYRVAETIDGGHGISYGKSSTHVVIDFWVENVRGVPVVIETWRHDGAPNQMVHQIARSRMSITLEPGG